jgi:hypothetical protein
MMERLTIPDVIDRFRAYHRKHPGSWGSLHIVLDENNVADHNVRFCIEWAEEHGDTEAVELGKILLQMSKTQRSRIGKILDRG